MLQQKVNSSKRYWIDFSEWQVFINNERNHSSLLLEVTARGLSEIQGVTEVYRLHNLPEFYKIHASRPFLRDELETVDPNLLSLVSILRSVGAGECWHKHESYLDHLVDIYRILKIWRSPDAVCLYGLFHSAYSNSYVNLAIFDPSTGRDTVRGYVSEEAERLIHLFCIIPRQPLIHSKEIGIFDRDERWRKNLNSLLSTKGVVMKYIKPEEDVTVSRRVVGYS